MTDDPTGMRRFDVAPSDRIDEHPDLVEDVMRSICGWEPEDYALSDESLLSDMVDYETDLDALYATVRETYGIEVSPHPEPYLWQLIDVIVATRGRQ